MYAHSPLWHYLWLAPHLIQAALVILMVRRGQAREFPVFLTYLAVDCLEQLVLFTADHWPHFSPELYWQMLGVATASTVALRFGVIYEILRHVFRPFPGLERGLRVLLRWIAVVLLLAGIGIAAHTPSTYDWLMTGVNVAQGVAGLMQAGMVVALFLFAGYFGITVRSFVFGIIVGLGLMASVNLAVEGVGISFPVNTYGVQLDMLGMATYHVSVLVWLYYLLYPVPIVATQSANALPESNLQRWNAELERLLMR